MPPEAINLQLSGLRKQGENKPVSDYWSDTMVDALDVIHKGVHRVRILDVWLKGVRATAADLLLFTDCRGVEPTAQLQALR